MKKSVIISTTIATTAINANAGYQEVSTLRELSISGFSAELIQQEFLNTLNIKLDLNEALKVTPSEEGKSLEIETFDNKSIIIPLEFADGSPNKIDPTGPN